MFTRVHPLAKSVHNSNDELTVHEPKGRFFNIEHVQVERSHMGSIGDQGLGLPFRCSIIKAERKIMVLFKEGKAIVESCCKDDMVDAVDCL